MLKMDATNTSKKVRIAHLSGPTANHPEHAAVTHIEQGARQAWLAAAYRCGMVLRCPHDALRSQRLAAAAKVYVEQFSGPPAGIRRS